MEGGREGKEEMEEGRQKGREAVDAVTKSQCINNKQLLDYKIPQTEKLKKTCCFKCIMNLLVARRQIIHVWSGINLNGTRCKQFCCNSLSLINL